MNAFFKAKEKCVCVWGGGLRHEETGFSILVTIDIPFEGSLISLAPPR